MQQKKYDDKSFLGAFCNLMQISQIDLAQRIGATKQQISYSIKKKALPSKPVLNRIKKAFDIEQEKWDTLILRFYS